MISGNGENGIAKRFMVVAVVVGMLVILASVRVEGADWRYFGMLGPYTYYYDSGRISYESNGVKVWVCYVVTNKESSDWVIQSRKKKGLSTKGYEEYTQSVALWIIKCSNNKWRVLEGTDYDNKGRPLESFTPPKSINWLEIIPTSSVAVLHKVVCR